MADDTEEAQRSPSHSKMALLSTCPDLDVNLPKESSVIPDDNHLQFDLIPDYTNHHNANDDNPPDCSPDSDQHSIPRHIEPQVSLQRQLNVTSNSGRNSEPIFVPLPPSPREVTRMKKCVKLMGEKVIRDIVRELYADPKMNTNDGTMTLAEYCAQGDTNPLSDPAQRSFLNCNLKEKNFDLRFGYEVLTKICVRLYQRLSTECRRDVRQVCEMVSDVMLGQVARLDVDARPLLDTMRIKRDSIYLSVGHLTGKDMNHYTDVTEILVDEILNTDSDSKDDFEVKHSQLMMYQTLRMTVKGYQELSEHYEKFADLNPFSWGGRQRQGSSDEFSDVCLKVEDIFIEPKLQEGDKSIALKKILNVDGLVVLQGLAGSGKTSLCQFLVHEWLKGREKVDRLNRFDLVFFIETKSVRSSSLREYLLDQVLPLNTAGFDPDLIIPTLKELNVLFIIDGYDETTLTSCALMEDILAKFGKKQIVLTGRPEIIRDVICLAGRHRLQHTLLEVCPLEEEMQEQLSCKIFKFMLQDKTTRQGHRKAFLEYTRERRKLLDPFLKLPLTAAILALLWIEHSGIFATITYLYQEIFRQLTRNLCERISKDFIGASDLPEILQNLSLSLGEQAWNTLRGGSLELSQAANSQLESNCQEKGVQIEQVLSGFHLCHLHENSDEWKLKLAFYHASEARYLAAIHLADLVQKKTLKIQELGATYELCPEFEEVLMFLMGHLALKDNLTSTTVFDIFNIIKKLSIVPTNFIFWWNLFEESKRLPQVSTILSVEKLLPKHWQLDQTNATQAIRILCFIPAKVRTIVLDIPNEWHPKDVPSLLEVLQGVDEHIKKRLKKLIKIEMHLWRHESPASEDTSDEFLWALGCWGDLTCFTGALGAQPEGEELLACFPSLRSVQVRVSTKEAFKSLSIGLRKIYKNVRSLVVTLALRSECPSDCFSELRHNGTLELNMVGAKDEQKEWLVEVVKAVGGRGGCWRLRLEGCHMTYDALEWVVRHLRGHVRNKIDIETLNEHEEVN
ncbi:hypothetical protein Pmani_025887 [Petrolisthes manimaculis]|uniref:NACHT domain-containing protein n=1 Tax=Petrolisthes manimaculis TaxID=1843537 RepID=A0AAE1P7C0_9EUCA|nr:hypothetical protein Pmani_025887 [Petrolisthes manimaculis]